jgi:transposase-like protein
VKHFQKIHSDELRAAVVEIALKQGTTGAALGRMIRAGQVPGFPKPEHINDQTVRNWINDARDDAATREMSEMQRLAKQVFDVTQQEIQEIKRQSNPNRPAGVKPRTEPDPAKLRRLLETAQVAWLVMHPVAPPAVAPPQTDGTGASEISGADRQIVDALAQEE